MLKRITSENITNYKNLLDEFVKNKKIYETINKAIDSCKPEDLFISSDSLYFINTNLGLNNNLLIGKNNNFCFRLAFELESDDNFIAYDYVSGNNHYNVIIKFLDNNIIDVLEKQEVTDIENENLLCKKIQKIYKNNELIHEKSSNLEINYSNEYINKYSKKEICINENTAYILNTNSVLNENNSGSDSFVSSKYHKIPNCNFECFDNRDSKNSNFIWSIKKSTKEEFENAKQHFINQKILYK